MDPTVKPLYGHQEGRRRLRQRGGHPLLRDQPHALPLQGEAHEEHPGDIPAPPRERDGRFQLLYLCLFIAGGIVPDTYE